MVHIYATHTALWQAKAKSAQVQLQLLHVHWLHCHLVRSVVELHLQRGYN